MSNFLKHIKKPSKHSFVEAGLLVSITILAVGFVIYMPPLFNPCELLESEENNPHCQASPPAIAPSKDALKKAQEALERNLENEQAQ